jgi:hypothetical protein
MLHPPDESFFELRSRDGIINRTTFLEIPFAIQEQLNRTSNKRRADSDPGPNQKQSKSNIKVSHDNQPMEINISPEQYQSRATPFLQANKDKIPKFDSSTDECLKFSFLGYCNSDCPRKKAHTKVQRGTKRFDNLLKLKQSIMKSQQTSTSQKDFPEGESK